MATLSDVIESHLLGMLGSQPEVEVQRAELAARFGCAPSQINYVLVTRFTAARGFLVESRRGGGGFIRLVRLPTRACDALGALPAEVDQACAEHHLERLASAGILTPREAAMLRAVVAREVLALPLPLRDRIRAAILRAALAAAARAAPPRRVRGTGSSTAEWARGEPDASAAPPDGGGTEAQMATDGLQRPQGASRPERQEHGRRRPGPGGQGRSPGPVEAGIGGEL